MKKLEFLLFGGGGGGPGHCVIFSGRGCGWGHFVVLGWGEEIGFLGVPLSRYNFSALSTNSFCTSVCSLTRKLHLKKKKGVNDY